MSEGRRRMDKQQILDEIHRTTRENGGLPLGSRRFEIETGIQRFDWYGKYWARWGDALEEAGYEPNTMQEPYSDEFILDHYARLALELGKLPSNSDLRLRAGQDPGFPNDKTFYRALGNKDEQVARLAAYCTDHPEFEPVVAFCEAYRPRRRARKAGESAPAGESLGSVYLMKSGKYYKIGLTNDVGRRRYDLAIQLPEPVSVVHEIRTDDPPGIEAYWHHRFKDRRKGGEWFDLTSADIRAFKRRKIM